MSLSSEERLAEYYRLQLAYTEKRIKRLKAGKPIKREMQPEAYAKRQRIWTHNSFKGHCAMAMKNFERIQSADSTTETSKKLAYEILQLIYQLQNSLTERKD